MQSPMGQPPNLPALTDVLMSVLGEEQSPTVVHRERNLYTCRFASEIVTCRFGDGQERRLFCKYGPGDSLSSHGHRGGVKYEAEVQRRVLASLPLSAPTFYGAHDDLAAGQTWLISEFLEASPLHHPGTFGMVPAARWIGRFHALSEVRLTDPGLSFLNRYTPDYFVGWLRRTREFSGAMEERLPWLDALCERGEDALVSLAASPQTIIHGEFTMLNVLIRDEGIYPVDWESAAVGAGEIDLAGLTDHWPADIVQDCVREYRQARWSDGPSPSAARFERRLEVARLYWNFRWLGDRREWTTDPGSRWRFEALYAAGQRLGLI